MNKKTPFNIIRPSIKPKKSSNLKIEPQALQHDLVSYVKFNNLEILNEYSRWILVA